MITGKCIHQVFEEQSKVTPNNIAVKYQDKTLTYTALNNYSNAIATKLLDKNIQIEDFVIVYMDRRLELMMSIYGILKAGGVYVPVSGDFPKQRFLDVIKDTKAKVILTEQKYLSQIPEGIETIVVDSLINSLTKEDCKHPNVDVQPNNLAYAIFTSGSTGKPKGVLIEHHSVINRIEWMQKEYPINASDVILQKTTITFDVSIWELFWWSFVGAKQVLLPNLYEKSPEKLFECVVEENITVMHFVPSMFNVSLCYLESVHPENKLAALKWIFCSGEELLSNSVSQFYELSAEKQKNNALLINLYGPTEATVDVTYYTCPKTVPPIIPIGKAIDNTQIYIINEKNQLLPPNTEGELVICGVNLARGYLNRQQLTAEKFINIEVNNEQVRAYKTGDIAYVDNSGDIIYKGRIDNQVKIRGFRIELGEIESRILEIEGVTETACIVEQSGTVNAKIICYYISEVSTKNEPGFKEYLEDKMPSYMIPSKFVRLDSLPRNLSGKIDRKKLINSKARKEQTEQPGFLEPERDIEQTIEGMWKGLLKIDNVPHNANFFDLGGNSILLIQLSLLLKENLGIDIDVLTIFQYPTIKSLTEHVRCIKQ